MLFLECHTRHFSTIGTLFLECLTPIFSSTGRPFVECQPQNIPRRGKRIFGCHLYSSGGQERIFLSVTHVVSRGQERGTLGATL
jgi:hypothetical protein